MLKCISHKKVYQTVELAEEALIQAHTQFTYREGTGPITIYKCEECGFYHFTSKGAMNERLVAYLKDGRMKRAIEAGQWEKKWRDR